MGTRKFARGRAYDPERYDGPEGEAQPDLDLDEAEEASEIALPLLEEGGDEPSAAEDFTEEAVEAEIEDDDNYYDDEDEDAHDDDDR